MSSSSLCSTGLSNQVLTDGFCSLELPVNINQVRSIRVVGRGINEILVVDRGVDSVLYIYDSDGDGIPDSQRTLVTASNLNHGLAIHDGYLYASSDTTVYRWPYNDDDDATNNNGPVVGEQEIAVTNMNADGMGGAPRGHTTRTIEFDNEGRIYISVGSNGNVDPDSYRSRIRRGDIINQPLPLDFQTMDVFADGLRNEVGLAFDRDGVLWGVENSADNLFRDDLGGRIVNDNPAEELNRFREEDFGKHYGYPWCWTEYLLPEPYGLGRGTVWAWPTFLDSGEATDDQCRQDFEPPMLSLQAHSAPLGITFYNYVSPDNLPTECNAILPFPEEMDGFAFIAYHGSWNRDIPTGYKVVYVPMENGIPLCQPIDLLAHEPPNAQWEDGFRPVDVAFDTCGRLYVTSDGTRGAGAKIVRIEYVGGEAAPSSPPSPEPSFLDTLIPSAIRSDVPTTSPMDANSTIHPSCMVSDNSTFLAPSGSSSSGLYSTSSEWTSLSIVSLLVLRWFT